MRGSGSLATTECAGDPDLVSCGRSEFLMVVNLIWEFGVFSSFQPYN